MSICLSSMGSGILGRGCRIPMCSSMRSGTMATGWVSGGCWSPLDKYNIKCCVSLNLAVLEHYPEIKDAMVERDWDIMSHGIYNTRYLNTLSAEEEREFYRDCIATLKRETGKDLKGMLGPALSNSERTPDLMAEAGLIYHTDWNHDDQPVPIPGELGQADFGALLGGAERLGDVHPHSQ